MTFEINATTIDAALSDVNIQAGQPDNSRESFIGGTAGDAIRFTEYTGLDFTEAGDYDARLSLVEAAMNRKLNIATTLTNAAGTMLLAGD